MARQHSRRHSFRLALVLGTALAATGLVVPAQAASVPQVYDLSNTAQNWYGGRLKMHWAPVVHATYQLRWSRSSAMSGATVLPTTTNTAWVGPLYRGAKWYFQARAIRYGHPGAWSRVRTTHFTNKWPAPARPQMSGIPGGVQVTWPYAAYASRYRVKWAPAAYDTWPGPDRYMDPTAGGWIPQTARRSTWRVPTDAATDPTMTALPYAGPIFTRVETSNAFVPGSLRLSPWKFAFPSVPAPAAGNPVRFGTYNVMLGGTLEDSSWSSRYPVIAKNILSHGVSMVALQEIFADSRSRNGAQDVAAWLTTASGHRWGVEGDGAEGRILYDTTRFAVTGSGLLNDYGTITNMHNGDPLRTPWARFVPRSNTYTRPLVVVSAHFVPSGATTGTYNHQNNLDTGRNATQVLAALRTLQARLGLPADPVIIAGDFSANNTETGDTSPARPTFVRAGFYDAMAAMRKVGIAYGTVNRRAVQAPASSGVAARADAIMLKGIVGTRLYDNVYNWRDGKPLPPSDHNLVFTDLQIPN